MSKEDRYSRLAALRDTPWYEDSDLPPTSDSLGSAEAVVGFLEGESVGIFPDVETGGLNMIAKLSRSLRTVVVGPDGSLDARERCFTEPRHSYVFEGLDPQSAAAFLDARAKESA